MPWFPDFVSAAELVRRQTRLAGHADPVGQYLRALNDGDADALETVWPADVVVNDPRVGHVEGHRQLRHFVRQSRDWLKERHARTEAVAATCVGNRAVIELVAHLDGNGLDLRWPVAIVVESSESSVVFRTYCNQRAVTGQRFVRAALLEADAGELDGVVGRHFAASMAGDVQGVLGTFAADGYLREPTDSAGRHRGSDELGRYFTECFRGGGITRQPCAVTDDGVRCVVEYNCVRWGGHDLPPQAGLGVFERSPDGLLSAVRIYDDVEPPP